MRRINVTKILMIVISTVLVGSCSSGGSSGGDSSANSAEPQVNTNPKDPAVKTASTVTIADAFNITSANTATYFVVGTCSDNDRPVNGSIGSITFSTICSDNTWTTGTIDVSTLPDTTDLLITADHFDGSGFSQVQTTVFKNTLTPLVSILSPKPISAENVTDYSIEGNCSENGQIVTVRIDSLTFTPNCVSGYWTTGYVDVSSILDSPMVNVTADHQNISGDLAIPATMSVVKNLSLPTASISSAPDINISNQNSYTVSGTCSETDQTVDVNIGTIHHISTCFSDTWILSSIDVSSLEDGDAIIVSADHQNASGDEAAQASLFISKETSTPAVSGLSTVFTLPNKAEITWSLEDSGGFSIDDYRINYRIKGTSIWLLFDDETSISTTATITGLNPATTYEFRVALLYSGSYQSTWANSLQAETKPTNPIFGENTAMNVGGADESSVVTFEDDTTVTLNGSDLVTLNKGQTHVFPSTQFDVIDADKPIFTAGRIGPNSKGKSGANMVWVPVTWASRSFSFNATRYNAQKIQIYPIESGSITLKSGNTMLASADLTAGVGESLEWNTYGSYQISSTGMVLVYHYASGSSSYVDCTPLLPSSKKIIGFPSTSMRLTSIFDGTNYTAKHSNDTTITSNLNKLDSIKINPEGTVTSLYKGDSLLIMADKEVSGASYADSNGYSSSVFLPVSKMKNTYALNADAEYLALASLKPGIIKILDKADNIIVLGSLNKSGGLPGSPYKARFENLPAGTRIFSTVPMAAWYQPSGYVGSMRNDETILYGTNLDDPTSVFTPTVNPKTCLTLKTDEPTLTDGIYEIDPDGEDGEAPYDAYCDMTTQGGGWTLVLRYDRDLATPNDYSLPMGAGRSIINGEDMITLEATTNLAGSLDIRPFIKSGATHFMHATTPSNDINYTYTYFSDINLYVRMFPESIFDSSMDTNKGEVVKGTAVDWSEFELNRWYENDFSIMINSQTSGVAGRSHQSIRGGEGRAMFTNGNREGAVFSSGVTKSGSVQGHSNPKVQWGFKGKDGTSQTYGGTIHVGTYCSPSLGRTCQSSSRMNFMFVR